MRKKYLIFTGALLACTVLMSLTSEYWTALVPKCYIYEMTGIYCPGCGGTRSVLALLKGQVWTAFKYNPGVIVLVLTALFAILGKIFNKKILPEALSFWVVLIVILFAYYILRNFIPSIQP